MLPRNLMCDPMTWSDHLTTMLPSCRPLQKYLNYSILNKLFENISTLLFLCDRIEFVLPGESTQLVMELNTSRRIVLNCLIGLSNATLMDGPIRGQFT